jgi:hypothetical protein
MMSRIHAAAIAALLLTPTIHLLAEDAEPVDPTDEELTTPAPQPKSEPTPPAKPAPRAAPEPASGLTPPAEPGGTRMAVEGCLASKGQKSSTESRTSRSAPADGDSEVEVVKAPGGAIVTHHLSHNCCLKAQVTAKIEQDHVVVLEKLVGKPCKCKCKSVLRTAVGLTPGWWTVDVDVDTGGKVERVTAQMVSVPEK